MFRRLRQALPDCTLIASVHRLAALPNFDRIVLMADGRVLDTGPVDDLTGPPAAAARR